MKIPTVQEQLRSTARSRTRPRRIRSSSSTRMETSVGRRAVGRRDELRLSAEERPAVHPVRVGAKLKVKQCGGSLDAGFFYDEDDDGTYDAADDFCWGLGGYDADCDCVADTGGGTGDMTKAVYDTDNDSTVDLAEALATPRLRSTSTGTGRGRSVCLLRLFTPTLTRTGLHRTSSVRLRSILTRTRTEHTEGNSGEAGGYSASTFSFVSNGSVILKGDNDEDGTGGVSLSVEGKMGFFGTAFSPTATATARRSGTMPRRDFWPAETTTGLETSPTSSDARRATATTSP